MTDPRADNDAVWSATWVSQTKAHCGRERKTGRDRGGRKTTDMRGGTHSAVQTTENPDSAGARWMQFLYENVKRSP